MKIIKLNSHKFYALILCGITGSVGAAANSPSVVPQCNQAGAPTNELYMVFAGAVLTNDRVNPARGTLNCTGKSSSEGSCVNVNGQQIRGILKQRNAVTFGGWAGGGGQTGSILLQRAMCYNGQDIGRLQNRYTLCSQTDQHGVQWQNYGAGIGVADENYSGPYRDWTYIYAGVLPGKVLDCPGLQNKTLKADPDGLKKNQLQ